jgi:hypothetical protein
MFKVIFNYKHYEQLIPKSKDFYWKPIAWDDKQYKSDKKLRIGYWHGVGLLMPATCMNRAVDITIEAL